MNKEAELLQDLTREQIVMEIYDVKVGAEGELLGDLAGEMVGGEVKDGEVNEVLEVGGDWIGKGVKGNVEGLEVGAVGDAKPVTISGGRGFVGHQILKWQSHGLTFGRTLQARFPENAFGFGHLEEK
ncbi:hypothetical protein F0562_016647 [Nyssa sinensis]|uniref:Uncharacterized protein n=1 Tax=Nyssa sinensis TaxID=561372 RepID=A0A5J4ZEW6_9ASTE|nr:hypothetical protein F0562_016647 [Nyssa sinensis]